MVIKKIWEFKKGKKEKDILNSKTDIDHDNKIVKILKTYKLPVKNKSSQNSACQLSPKLVPIPNLLDKAYNKKLEMIKAKTLT